MIIQCKPDTKINIHFSEADMQIILLNIITIRCIHFTILNSHKVCYENVIAKSSLNNMIMFANEFIYMCPGLSCSEVRACVMSGSGTECCLGAGTNHLWIQDQIILAPGPNCSNPHCRVKPLD